MEGREHVVRSRPVPTLARSPGRSAYDCEFVALAEAVDVPLVTTDRELAGAFPDRTVRLAAFAG